jgi:hypothetical protein
MKVVIGATKDGVDIQLVSVMGTAVFCVLDAPAITRVKERSSVAGDFGR